MTEDIDTVVILMQISVSINLSYLCFENAKMGAGIEMYHLRLELPLFPPRRKKRGHSVILAIPPQEFGKKGSVVSDILQVLF